MHWEMPDGTRIADPIGSNIVYPSGDIRNYTKPQPYTYEEALEIWLKANGYVREDRHSWALRGVTDGEIGATLLDTKEE